MKKIIKFAVLAASIVAAVYLTCFLEETVYYSECVVSEEQFEEMAAARVEMDKLLDALVFDEETLFFDQNSRTFYYSLIEGNAGAYDPGIRMKGRGQNLKIAFLENRITEEGIKNNRTIDFLVYTDGAYSKYRLKCTTLPLMDIECSEEILDEIVPMSITVFDNRKGAVNRAAFSEGVIRIRGASTKGYAKRGYRLYLTQESAGGHVRANDISLLGMRQDDDWLLYAAYNDQEKIRNVFSSNLWQDTCATDNKQKINAGMEYKYLELFINGGYSGLYALGYPIDKKQMLLDAGSGEEALYKVTAYVDGRAFEFTEEGNIDGYAVKGAGADEEGWSLLMEYYGNLARNIHDNDKLYAGIDIDNAIDLYLFINLIQGLDNTSESFIKNQYILVKNGREGLTALYAPWDLDITWGNEFTGDFSVNYIKPYSIPADFNWVIESGYLNQLIVNGDDSIWDKIFAKYHFLRDNGWSEAHINSMLDEYEADIYGSGAYLRDMERWPEGTYATAADGLNTFRSYVMKRIQEVDLYYERLAALCEESIFIKRSAQYKDFGNCRFIIEINNRDFLESPDYVALFDYMGVDAALITEEVHFVLANPAEGKFEYLSTLGEKDGERETCVGRMSFSATREGVYVADLDGVICYDTTLFSKPEIRMAMIKDSAGKRYGGGYKAVNSFDFTRGYDTPIYTSAISRLSTYLDGIASTSYQAVIEINNPEIWQDSAYIELFGKLGVAAGAVSGKTDFIIWDGVEKDVALLEGFHVSGSRSETALGALSLFENDQGVYGVYLDNEECFVSSQKENKDADLRIVLLDSVSKEVVDNMAFTYDGKDD